MSLNYFFNSLNLIIPEIIISVAIVVVLFADLFFKKRKYVLPVLSLIGVVIAGIFVIINYNQNGAAFVTNNSPGIFAVDTFGTFFKLIIILGSILIILFSIISKELDESSDRFGEYYTLLLGMILGMFFMVSASDLILIYLSIELVSLSSYILAGFIKYSTESSEASLKYIIYGAVASAIMLFGISLIFGLTGTTNLYALNMLLNYSSYNSLILIFSIILIFAGIGYKISSVPFHFWTPDVYEGSPTPITAYLSVASKAAGFALFIRFIKVTFVSDINSLGMWLSLPAFEWQNFLIIISILTMTLGNFAALWQDNVKRMLAYSSIAHAGYMLAALASFSNQGLTAILIYFVAYLLMNLGAFLVVIIIRNKIGSEDINDYNGLGYSMPVLGVCLAIFLISLTGIPPTFGFVGKLYIFLSMIDAKLYVLAIITFLNSVVSLYYYIRILKFMFLNRPEEEIKPIPIPFSNSLLVLILTVPVILFGLYFSPILEWIKYSITF